MKENLIIEFENYLVGNKTFSTNTINSYKLDVIKLFNNFKDKDNKIDFLNLSEEVLCEYINSLKREGYSVSTLSRNLSSLNLFVEFLYFKKYIPQKIYLDMKFTKKDNEEFIIFSRKEINKILDIKGESFINLRDKAIFELVYAIGIKPSECIDLNISDVNLEIGYLKYRSKEAYRTVPLTNEAIESIKKYLSKFKSENIIIDSEKKLFLTSNGHGLTRQGFWKIFKKRQQELQLDKELNTTTFRNSLVIHLLEDGISAEDIQEILGLKNISSLKAYLKKMNSKRNSKKIMMNHPRNSIKNED